jgi:hypothetical protein
LLASFLSFFLPVFLSFCSLSPGACAFATPAKALAYKATWRSTGSCKGPYMHHSAHHGAEIFGVFVIAPHFVSSTWP